MQESECEREDLGQTDGDGFMVFVRDRQRHGEGDGYLDRLVAGDDEMV